MKKIILTLLLLIGFNSYSQKLKCKDFKSGIFIIPSDKTLPISFKIIRNGNSQIEIYTKTDKETNSKIQDKSYEIIEWINDCVYKLKYDESKMKLTESQKFINKNGGILIKMIKIEGKCFYYKSTITANGNDQQVDGKICIE